MCAFLFKKNVELLFVLTSFLIFIDNKLDINFHF